MENLTLLVSAPDAKILVNHLIYLVAKNECYIEESRFMALGSELGGMLRIAGSWNAIAKMEDALQQLKSENQIWLEFKRSTHLKLAGEYIPYLVQIVGINKPTLINEMMHFFVEQNIQPTDLQTDSFKTNYSDTKMLTLVTRLQIPGNINIADLRERFMLLCEELNVDGILEPEKSIK